MYRTLLNLCRNALILPYCRPFSKVTEYLLIRILNCWQMQHSDRQTTRLVKNNLGVEKEANLHIVSILRSLFSRYTIAQLFPCTVWTKTAQIILADLNAIKPLIVCFSSLYR